MSSNISFMKNLRHLLFLMVLTGVHAVSAQTGFYVPAGGKVFFNGDTATIFSNVTNKGSIGTGKGAYINFAAQSWVNAPAATMPDESAAGTGTSGTGGIFHFISDTIHQQIDGGYDPIAKAGPSFPNIKVNNQGDIDLINTSLKIRSNLLLTNGLVYLNDNILVVGNGNAGNITGYDSSRYIVANFTTSGGYLLRENISEADGLVIFPIGSKANAYTPAGIRSDTSLGDDFFAGVRDTVRTNLFAGSVLIDSSIDKTWEIGKQLYPGIGAAEVYLQHLLNDEGSDFVARRGATYVAEYIDSAWDSGYPRSLPLPGYLTTGPYLANSGTNSRVFKNTISSNSYFTKFAGTDTGSTTLILFAGYRVDDTHTFLYWETNPEINNKYFVLQRRDNDRSSFVNIDTVMSNAQGKIQRLLYYSVKDTNSYQDTSFYRLILVDNKSILRYTDSVAITGAPRPMLLWPNPATDHFYVGLNGNKNVKSVYITDLPGQNVWKEDVNGRNIIEIQNMAPGTYLVSFTSNGNEIIETKKVVILGGY